MRFQREQCLDRGGELLGLQGFRQGEGRADLHALGGDRGILQRGEDRDGSVLRSLPGCRRATRSHRRDGQRLALDSSRPPSGNARGNPTQSLKNGARMSSGILNTRHGDEGLV